MCLDKLKNSAAKEASPATSTASTTTIDNPGSPTPPGDTSSSDSSRSPSPETKAFRAARGFRPSGRDSDRIVIYLTYYGKHRIPIQSTVKEGVSYDRLVKEAELQFGIKERAGFVIAGLDAKRVVTGDILREDGVEVEVLDPIMSLGG